MYKARIASKWEPGKTISKATKEMLETYKALKRNKAITQLGNDFEKYKRKEIMQHAEERKSVKHYCRLGG